jgi:hypothetical protein
MQVAMSANRDKAAAQGEKMQGFTFFANAKEHSGICH